MGRADNLLAQDARESAIVAAIRSTTSSGFSPVVSTIMAPSALTSGEV